jgi:hypothetical protein
MHMHTHMKPCCSDGASVGPAGVTLLLAGKDGSKHSTATTEGGVFSFKDAKAGMTYTLTASHPKWKFRKASVDARLEFGQSEVREPFGVLGYEAKAKIAWQGDHVAGIGFLLRPEKAAARPQDLACALAGARTDGTWCTAAADASGAIVFEHVPPGKYTVVPDMSAPAASKIEIAPKQISVTVHHGHAETDAEFSLAGFSLGGKVIDPAGNGLVGVDVFVDGVKMATTDTKGAYTMLVQAGKHTVTASRQHIKFSTLSNYDLSPNLKRVSSLSVEAYALCGKVAFESVPNGKRSITAKADKGGASLTAVTADDGSFCFNDAPPGRFCVCECVWSVCTVRLCVCVCVCVCVYACVFVYKCGSSYSQ